MTVAITLGCLAVDGSSAACTFGPDQCKPGFVWRDAFSGDHVCVTGATRTQAASDNRQANSRKVPNSDACKFGWVWREASSADHVCVTGATRAAAGSDNAQAASRRDPQCAVPTAGIHFETEKAVAATLPPKASYTRTTILADGTVQGISQGPLSGVPDKMWNPGQVLRVRMSGGTALVRSKVRQFATEWTKIANINFSFVDDSQPAEIRIDFGADGFSWSVVGRDALGVPFDFATMHYGWFDDTTSDTEFSRVVLHEFGHALGLIHEHQSPVAGIQWDKNKVYAFFASMTPPWDSSMVDTQVFQKYSVTSTNFSAFDPTSIMEYSFPSSLTLNGIGVPGNTTLSPVDRQFIAKWYPFPSSDSGQLRTNDDCDQIDFQVEYGVEAKDKLRVLFRPGPTVTWWKSIEIPFGASSYFEMPIEGTNSRDSTFDKVTLDASRPIRFNKAKFLGVHTLLDYRWDVISALPGGSRVTLDWSNDHCH